jgi:hypothetical protein
MNRLVPLEHWIRGFESHSRHECLFAFLLCLCCSVCRQWPCDGLIPVQGVIPTVCRIKILKKQPKSEGLYTHKERERERKRERLVMKWNVPSNLVSQSVSQSNSEIRRY